jgi:hypothetical protein
MAARREILARELVLAVSDIKLLKESTRELLEGWTGREAL